MKPPIAGSDGPVHWSWCANPMDSSTQDQPLKFIPAGGLAP